MLAHVGERCGQRVAQPSDEHKVQELGHVRRELDAYSFREFRNADLFWSRVGEGEGVGEGKGKGEWEGEGGGEWEGEEEG